MTKHRPIVDAPETADAASSGLLARLCEVDQSVIFFPVRHHSPAAARLVVELIDRRRPAAVLIEGPSDFNDRLDELLLDHELPIAIYSYFRTEAAHGGAYYPFCDYSPEWTALRRAKKLGLAARFIDLPWTEVSHLDRATHRYADAELRRGKYVERLCERLEVENFDELWDKLIESNEDLDLADYLARTHAFCFQTRRWDDAVSLADRRREAFMVDEIRRMREAVEGPILVVTGGYHSSALAARLEGWSCPGTEPEEGPTASGPAEEPERPVFEESGIALTTYSYERLDNLTGYNSGMPNPGFYEEAWNQRQHGKTFSHRPLLSLLVQELRARKQTLSTADLIAVETAVCGLAALRGRSQVWRRDLVDAVTSALVKDELENGVASSFVDAIHAVLRGNRRGALAAGTRHPPLVLDIDRQLAEADLKSAPAMRQVELDLLVPTDQGRSRLLHRLRVLGIVGYDRIGGTDFLARENLERLWETWRIRWSPEFEATCVEASRYGTSLVDAVTNRLTELARQPERDASAAAALLVQAAQAGIDTLSQTLIDQLTHLIEEESRFEGIAAALEHLLFLYCHDEAFGTSRLPQIGQLVVAAFGRTLWILESLGQSTGNEKVRLGGMKALLETFQRTGVPLDLDRTEFLSIIGRVEGDTGKPPTLRGAAAGILWTLGAADEDQVLADLLLFTAPSDRGDFLAGLFALAREVVQRQPAVVRTIDRLLSDFGSDDFQASLPSMRLAFTYFTPREKHYMLTTLFEALGLQEAAPLPDLAVDAATAAAALAFEERLFETIARYGLEAPRE